MKQCKRKILTVILALLIAISSTGITNIYAANNIGNGKYTIIDQTNMSARYDGPIKKSAASISIPDTVQINGKTYKVVSIANNALKNNKKLKKITIGNNIKTIGNNAFYGCKKLKNITIKTTKLTKKSVGAKAFAKINAKVIVTVPQSKLKAYKVILKNLG